jgi:hypothetical protein
MRLSDNDDQANAPGNSRAIDGMSVEKELDV